jgi:hypothetical protein
VGMRPGQMISLSFEDKRTEIVMIGMTGSYNLDSDIAIKEIRLLESNCSYVDGTPDPYLSGSLTPNIFKFAPLIKSIFIQPLLLFTPLLYNIFKKR